MAEIASEHAGDAIATTLEHLAHEADLLAAHHAEWIAGAEPAPLETQAALRAAVSYGCAIGLRRAAELIVQNCGCGSPER